MNDLLNGKLGKKRGQKQETAQPAQTAAATAAPARQGAQISWNNYDFVSGDEIIFEDTMEGEKL